MAADSFSFYNTGVIYLTLFDKSDNRYLHISSQCRSLRIEHKSSVLFIKTPPLQNRSEKNFKNVCFKVFDTGKVISREFNYRFRKITFSENWSSSRE